MTKKRKKTPRGRRNGKFKGGTNINSEGYLRITAGPLRGTYVHRLVLEAKLGRKLAKDEDAHHIDGDPLNPHPDNLEAVPKELHHELDEERRAEEAPF